MSIRLLLFFGLFATVAACAQTTQFSYQGRLVVGGEPATGIFDFEFRLFGSETGGALLGDAVGTNAVPVTNGVFTVALDFGVAAFNGESRWLEIWVKNSLTDKLATVLTPRQAITPAPYATHAYNAASLMSFANAPLDIKVNGQRAWRVEPTTGDAPNIIGGYSGNGAGSGAAGVFIGGGGMNDGSEGNYPNIAGANFAAIAGGYGNRVLDESGFIGGGEKNSIALGAYTSVIGGGHLNRIDAGAPESFIGGGRYNSVGENSVFCAVAGGFENRVLSNAPNGVIAGGEFNTIEPFSPYGTIAGGQNNSIFGSGATIGGGIRNRVSESGGTIAGGFRNFIDEEATFAAIGGGFGNSVVDAEKGTIGGGEANQVHADYGTIAGGQNNRVPSLAAEFATIGGGNNNTNGSPAATIAGGKSNSVGSDSSYSTIAGGEGNVIASEAWNSSIGGGEFNAIQTQSDSATIGGGARNLIREAADSATVAGGERNEASEKYATVGGGGHNVAAGFAAVVAGGGGIHAEDAGEVRGNLAAGNWSAVLGGADNVAEGAFTVVAGGEFNRADGDYGVAAGGLANRAAGVLSFAAGWHAEALHSGAWVWADNSPTGGGGALASTTNNQFTARAAGGVRFFTDKDATTGVELAPGSGSWSTLSDRNAKENFVETDCRAILEKVAALPLATWNYRSQDRTVRHIGPVAQDFHAAFGVGEDVRRISSVDADGVALAAIQGLNEKFEEENRALRGELKAREAEIEELRRAVAGLRALIDRR